MPPRCSPGTTIHQIGTGDVNGPVVQSISLTPSVVDEATGDTEVDLDAVITDDYPGSRALLCAFVSPDGRRSFEMTGRNPAGDDVHLSRTIALNSLQPGDWKSSCTAFDAIGNESEWFAGPTLTIE